MRQKRPAADHSALFAGQSILGEWLRSRPAVLKLGDLLLLHDGISPAIVDGRDRTLIVTPRLGRNAVKWPSDLFGINFHHVRSTACSGKPASLEEDARYLQQGSKRG